MNEEKKEFGKWWIWVLALIILSVATLKVTGAFGKIFSTTVERKIFEESYQKKAGDKARLSAYEAQLAQINTKINLSTNLDENTRINLESQKAMLETQINAAKNR